MLSINHIENTLGFLLPPHFWTPAIQSSDLVVAYTRTAQRHHLLSISVRSLVPTLSAIVHSSLPPSSPPDDHAHAQAERCTAASRVYGLRLKFGLMTMSIIRPWSRGKFI